MSDYKEPPVLDGSLSDRHRYLGYLLMSPGWKEVILPTIGERAKMLYDKLIDPKESRKENLPDDFIRGQIAVLKWIIEWPEKEMQLAAQQMAEQEIMNGIKAPTEENER